MLAARGTRTRTSQARSGTVMVSASQAGLHKGLEKLIRFTVHM